MFETDTGQLWFDADGRGRDTDGDGVIDADTAPTLVTTLIGITALGAADFSFAYDI